MNQLYFPRAFLEAIGHCERPTTGLTNDALALWDRFVALAKPTARRVALRNLVTSHETFVTFHPTLPTVVNTKVHHGAAPVSGIAGRGLFASKDIQMGEVILTEMAAAVISADGTFVDLTNQAADNLGGPDMLYKVMSSYYPKLIEDTWNPVLCMRSVRFNCSTLSTCKAYASAWFPVSGLINHSCLPNAEWATLEDNMVILAIRPIESGEHITISYCPPLTTWKSMPVFHEDRQRQVYEHCAFKCECKLCTAKLVVDGDTIAKKRALADFQVWVNGLKDPNMVMKECETRFHGSCTNWTFWIVLIDTWFQAYLKVRPDRLDIDRLWRMQQVLGFYQHVEFPHHERGRMCMVAAVTRLYILWLLAQRLPNGSQLRADIFEPAVAALFKLAATQGPKDLMALLLLH